MANDRFLEEDEGKMEEIGEYKQGWENFEERSNLNIILLIFREKKIRDIENTWYSLKLKINLEIYLKINKN